MRTVRSVLNVGRGLIVKKPVPPEYLEMVQANLLTEYPMATNITVTISNWLPADEYHAGGDYVALTATGEVADVQS